MIKRERGGSQGVEREGGTGGRGEGPLVRRADFRMAVRTESLEGTGVSPLTSRGSRWRTLGYRPWKRSREREGKLSTMQSEHDDADGDVGGCTASEKQSEAGEEEARTLFGTKAVELTVF